jgi:DNA helicase-2/ATP-dependent DNA helicase PcrA
MNLRPTQEAILAYEGGRMAVAAVPGSGKTFTLTRLAAQLIAHGRVDYEHGQQILIVTYLNASVDNFKARIRDRLEKLDINAPQSYDVRTLHSLGLEIVRLVTSGNAEDLIVLDESQASRYLGLAIDNWQDAHPDDWQFFIQDESPQGRARWRRTVERTAASFIRFAKNERYTPDKIRQKISQRLSVSDLADEPDTAVSPFLRLMADLYANYQTIITRQGALDFDDLIWQATDLVETRPDVREALRQRWSFVLEDEAQDSVPLQENLLQALTGDNGNWVRVGDPNQAITSTFTAAHPRFFNAFLDQPEVQKRPLPHSGRCSALIMGAANALVNWTCDQHPVPEVRADAFRRQEMLPTPPGDAQPNPPDDESKIVIKVFAHRELEEVPRVAQLAHLYAQKYPERTVAVLAPTNDVGHKVAEQLDTLKADYDNLLKGGTRVREISAALYALLALLANPLGRDHVSNVVKALHDLSHPAVADITEADMPRLQTVLRSVYQPESLLFPQEYGGLAAALPANVVQEQELNHIARLVNFLQRLFPLALLPIDDLVIALGDELFAATEKTGQVNETDLAIAYQVANVLRRWYDMEPSWRLPELAEQLGDVARGRIRLNVVDAVDEGFEPRPGRVTLTTQHSAKGLEWDAVFLIGIDGMWIPGSLDSLFLGVDSDLGGDPTAEITAQLQLLMKGHPTNYSGLTATESAHVEVIAERLRLLYVGITRARRFLHITRSRVTRKYAREYNAEPTTALGVLYRYQKQHTAVD